ncbi:MAG: signal peptidase II [Candidatus Moraniibacteriota bacterium]|jgi:signal peptidase II
MSFCLQKKSHTVLCGIFSIIGLIVIDQVIKFFILQSQAIESLCNYGIAMGIILPQIIFVGLWILIMLCVIYFWVQKTSDKFINQLPYILILSGGISNTIDRFYYGCVVDYIPFLNISSFNIADAYITIGAGLILWQSFRDSRD